MIDVNGVGYSLSIPFGADFHPDPSATRKDGQVRVWTHFVVREDVQELYGFPDPKLRELFRLLLKVRGVGPGMALAVLSSLPADELVHAITAGDLPALVRVKGVGKKTAEQILLDLRDKAPRFASSESTGVLVPRGRRTQAFDDAVRALLSIGYTDKQAEASVERATKEVDPEDLELLVRTALRHG